MSEKMFQVTLALNNGDSITGKLDKTAALALYNDLNSGTTTFVRLDLNAVRRSDIIKLSAFDLTTGYSAASNPPPISPSTRNDAF